MSVDAVHVPAHAISTNHTYSQNTELTLEPGVSEIVQGFDGEAFSTYIVAGEVAPTIPFTSAQIKACLDAVGSTGLALSGSEIFTSYLQKVIQGGLRAAASTNHISMVINEGTLVPRSISVENNGLATISMAAVATYNGSVLPVVILDSQNYIASASGLIGWTLGPIKPNGSAHAGVQRMTFDFGINLGVRGGDGEGFPTFVYVINTTPRITFSSTNASQIATLTALGKSQTNTLVYLRKMEPAGGTIIRVADGTAEHIKFSIAGDYGSPRTIGGAHGVATEFAVDLLPKSLDGTDPISIATTSTIT